MLDTDYDSFAFIYSCSFALPGIYRLEYAWILTRKALVEGTPEFDAIKKKAYAVFKDKVPLFDTSIMQTTK